MAAAILTTSSACAVDAATHTSDTLRVAVLCLSHSAQSHRTSPTNACPGRVVVGRPSAQPSGSLTADQSLAAGASAAEEDVLAAEALPLLPALAAKPAVAAGPLHCVAAAAAVSQQRAALAPLRCSTSAARAKARRMMFCRPRGRCGSAEEGDGALGDRIVATQVVGAAAAIGLQCAMPCCRLAT